MSIWKRYGCDIIDVVRVCKADVELFANSALESTDQNRRQNFTSRVHLVEIWIIMYICVYQFKRRLAMTELNELKASKPLKVTGGENAFRSERVDREIRRRPSRILMMEEVLLTIVFKN